MASGLDVVQKARQDNHIKEVWFDYEGKAVGVMPYVPWPGDYYKFLYLPDGVAFLGKTQEQIEQEIERPKV